jgi:phosphate starvation-inducible protein PhoH and related proteins
MNKPDKSAHVPQRDKIKSPFQINELNWTEKQKEFIKIALDKDTKIVFIDGPAGSSKTLLSVFCSLKLLNEKRVSDIVYIRSAVESSDSRLGYLPGDVDEKLHFYNLPFMDKLEELLSKADIDKLNKEQRITMYPVNFSRGMSWNAKCVVFDECQNSTAKEIITVLTRLGKFSKCFVLADPTQTDLHNGKGGGFERIIQLFNDDESIQQGIRVFKFTEDDILRSELVKFLVKKFKSLS